MRFNYFCIYTVEDVWSAGGNKLTCTQVPAVGIRCYFFQTHVFSFKILKLHSFQVNISRNMNRREVFMDIIKQFTKQTNDYNNISEEQFLKDDMYLIVMDDVRYKKDWKLLQIAFIPSLLLTFKIPNIKN
nr:putative late blight resistance protein homolog R1B-14 [Ipomoea batatas]